MHTGLIIGLSVVGTFTLQALIGSVIRTRKDVQELTKIVASIPGPEEMAKQVLKVKLPIADLPPEFQKKALQNIENNKKKKAKDLPIQETKDASYFG